MLKNSILKQAIHYFSGNVIAKLVQLSSLLIFTRLISPSDYGVYSVFIAYASIFVILLTLNSHVAVSRYYYEEKNDFDKFVGSTIILTTIIVILASSVLVYNIDFFSKWLQIPGRYIMLFIPISIIEFVTLLYIQIFQPLRKTKEIAKLIIAKALLSLIGSIVFYVLIDGDKLAAILYGYVAGNLLAVLYVMFVNKIAVKLTLEFIHFRYIYSYTFPLILYPITTFVLTQSDRIIIAKLSGAESAGLYSLASNISMIITVFYAAILSAWTPNYYERMRAGEYKKLNDETRGIFYISSIVASGLGLFGPDLAVYLFPYEYHGGLDLIPILVFALFINLGWQLYGRHFGYFKKTYFIAVIGLISSAISICSNFILIPKFEYNVAAITSVMAYGSMLILTIIVLKYILNVHSYPLAIMYMPILLVLTACIFGYFSQAIDLSLARFLLKLLLLFVIIIVTVRCEPLLKLIVESLLSKKTRS